MALKFTTALTHEANCFYVSEIVFKMTKTPDHRSHDITNESSQMDQTDTRKQKQQKKRNIKN